MKRIIIVAILALFLTVGTANAYYTVESGDTLSKIAYRAGMSLSAIINLNPQIANPDLIYPGDNINLDDGQFLVGAANPFRPSDVDIKIRQDLVSGSSRSGTTLNIDPIITPDNHRWTMTDIGNIAFGKIDPGTASNEEIISWTGMTDNTTYYTLTGVVWGYSYYDLSTSTANYKRHNSGARFIITDDDHFLNQQYVNKGYEQTISGQKTYSTYPKFSVTTTLPTLDSQFATKYYVDSVGAGGFTSLNVGTTRGLYALGTSPEKVGIATSTDSAYQGLYFDTSGKLGIKLNNSITSNADGLAIATTSDYIWTGNHTFNGENTFNATTTFKNISHNGFGGNGTDGALSISAGATTTLDANYANVLVKNYTSINIPNTAGLTLSNSSTTGTILVLKSQGNCVIGGNIWLTGFGLTHGAGTTTPYGMIDGSTNINGVDNGKSKVFGSAGGNRYATSTLYAYTTAVDSVFSKSIVLSPGTHGGDGTKGGGVNGGTAGEGGTGGGALIIECGGYITFTGSIVVDGGTGGTGGNAGASSVGGGGGGGGSAGMAIVLYNGLISNTGIIYARGGAGGAGGTGTVDGNDGNAGGGGGGSWSSDGEKGADGHSSGAGTAGTATTDASGAGGGSGGSNGVGGAGGAQGSTDPNHYYIGQNYWF